jgi:hypothetical protein
MCADRWQRNGSCTGASRQTSAAASAAARLRAARISAAAWTAQTYGRFSRRRARSVATTTLARGIRVAAGARRNSGEYGAARRDKHRSIARGRTLRGGWQARQASA